MPDFRPLLGEQKTRRRPIRRRRRVRFVSTPPGESHSAMTSRRWHRPRFVPAVRTPIECPVWWRRAKADANKGPPEWAPQPVRFKMRADTPQGALPASRCSFFLTLSAISQRPPAGTSALNGSAINRRRENAEYRVANVGKAAEREAPPPNCRPAWRTQRLPGWRRGHYALCPFPALARHHRSCASPATNQSPTSLMHAGGPVWRRRPALAVVRMDGARLSFTIIAPVDIRLATGARS